MLMNNLKIYVQKLKKYIPSLILVLSNFTVVWTTIFIWQSRNLNDDSFITLTYAKNLVAGNGFVYNHPPATLGTTSPLFTLLTALLAYLLPFFDVVDTAIFISSVAWIGVSWMLYLLFCRSNLSPIPAAIAAGIPLLIGQGWRSFIGMEIWVFQFLLVLSIYLAVKNRLFYAGLAVGALFLTRGEGALVGGILFGYLWLQHRRIPVKFVIGSASVVIVWILYSTIIFGTFIPNTLAAKQAQALLPSGGNFIDRVLFQLLPDYLRYFSLFKIWYLNPYLLLVVLGLSYAIYRVRILLIFVLWVGVYLVSYTLLNPKPYYWYMLHVVFVLQVFAGVGIAGLLTIALEKRPVKIRLFVISAFGLLLVFLMFFGISFVIESPAFSGDHRASTYKAISEWLQNNTEPEDSVAYIEIGYLGYFTDNRIVDMAGLIDPVVTEHIATDGFSWAFWHYQPDYYIYAEEFNWALGDVKSVLDDSYVPVHQIEREDFPTPIYIMKRTTFP